MVDKFEILVFLSLEDPRVGNDFWFHSLKFSFKDLFGLQKCSILHFRHFLKWNHLQNSLQKPKNHFRISESQIFNCLKKSFGFYFNLLFSSESISWIILFLMLISFPIPTNVHRIDAKQQIMHILEKISLLQPPERLLLYLRMPSSTSETGKNSQWLPGGI